MAWTDQPLPLEPSDLEREAQDNRMAGLEPDDLEPIDLEPIDPDQLPLPLPDDWIGISWRAADHEPWLLSQPLDDGLPVFGPVQSLPPAWDTGPQ